ILYMCFFCQAEDGIRDRNVTGVQTCALPILENELDLLRSEKPPSVAHRIQELTSDGDVSDNSEYEETKEELVIIEARIREIENKIGRASCREREEIEVGAIKAKKTEM